MIDMKIFQKVFLLFSGLYVLTIVIKNQIICSNPDIHITICWGVILSMLLMLLVIYDNLISLLAIIVQRQFAGVIPFPSLGDFTQSTKPFIEQEAHFKKEGLIVKHNFLVQSSYKLTYHEQIFIECLISLIEHDDVDFKTYKIQIKQLADLLELKDPNYSYMEQLTRQLIGKQLTIRLDKDQSDESKLILSWLSSAHYFYQDGCVYVRFDPGLKPYLLQLKSHFTKYPLKYVIQFKHLYSIRFYSLLKQYQNLKERYFDLKELRDILGIQDSEYILYANFKQKVIQPVQKELNEKYKTKELDLTFNFEEIKVERKVKRIKFIIISEFNNSSTYPQFPLLEIDQSSQQILDLLNLVPEKHRQKKTVKNLISKYFKKNGFEFVKRNIEYVNKHTKFNYRSYFGISLKEDYGLGLQEDQEQKQQEQKLKTKKEVEHNKEKIELEKQRNEQLKIREAIAKLLPDEQQKLHDEAERNINEQIKSGQKKPFGIKTNIKFEMDRLYKAKYESN